MIIFGFNKMTAILLLLLCKISRVVCPERHSQPLAFYNLGP
jgi:hypothetical protein